MQAGASHFRVRKTPLWPERRPARIVVPACVRAAREAHARRFVRYYPPLIMRPFWRRDNRVAVHDY